MTGCTAPNCTNSTVKGFKVYSFPRDKVRRSLWIDRVSQLTVDIKHKKPWKLSNNAGLCEIHFEQDQFEQHRQDGAHKLKPNAVPSLFPTSKLAKREVKKRNGINNLKINGTPSPLHRENFGALSSDFNGRHERADAQLNDAAAAKREQLQLQRVAQAAVAAVKFMESSTGNSSSIGGDSSGIAVLPSPLTILNSKPCLKSHAQVCLTGANVNNVSSLSDLSIAVKNSFTNTNKIGIKLNKLGPSKIICIKSSARVKERVNREGVAELDKRCESSDVGSCDYSNSWSQQPSKQGGSHENKLQNSHKPTDVKTKLLDAPHCLDPSTATELAELRGKVDHLTAVNSSLMKTNRSIMRQNVKLKKERQLRERAFKLVFNPDQMRALGKESTRGWNWSDDTIKNALFLKFSCGLAGYEELLRQHYPLPSLRTLQRRVNSAVQCDMEQSAIMTSEPFVSSQLSGNEDFPAAKDALGIGLNNQHLETRCSLNRQVTVKKDCLRDESANFSDVNILSSISLKHALPEHGNEGTTDYMTSSNGALLKPVNSTKPTHEHGIPHLKSSQGKDPLLISPNNLKQISQSSEKADPFCLFDQAQFLSLPTELQQQHQDLKHDSVVSTIASHHSDKLAKNVSTPIDMDDISLASHSNLPHMDILQLQQQMPVNSQCQNTGCLSFSLSASSPNNSLIESSVCVGHSKSGFSHLDAQEENSFSIGFAVPDVSRSSILDSQVVGSADGVPENVCNIEELAELEEGFSISKFDAGHNLVTSEKDESSLSIEFASDNPFTIGNSINIQQFDDESQPFDLLQLTDDSQIDVGLTGLS